VRQEDLAGVFFTITNSSAAKWCQALQTFKDVHYAGGKMASAKFDIKVLSDQSKRHILKELDEKKMTLTPEEFRDEMGFSADDTEFANADGSPSHELLR
jgi:hypothetical protein